MKVQTAVFGAIGIIVGLALLCFAALWLGKKFPDERYDERQKIARGNAYRFAFWVGAPCYLGVLASCIWAVDTGPAVEPYLLLYLAMAIQGIAFHMYCFVTRSAMPFGEKPLSMTICYAGLSFLQLFDFFRMDVKEVLPLLGRGTSVWTKLILGIFFGCLSVMFLLSVLIKEKE